MATKKSQAILYCPHEYPKDLRNLKEGEEADITCIKDGSVTKKLVKRGHVPDGEEYPCIGDKVCIAYVAYMGEIAAEYQFDKGDGYVIELGKGNVICGLEAAIYTMKKGETAIVTIQPQHAWGRVGNPPTILPDTTVVYEVQLLQFSGEDISEQGDGSVIRHILQSGTGYTKPNKGCMTELHIKGFHGDSVFDDRNIKYPFGEGAAPEYNIPEFIENALLEFRPEEKSRLIMKSEACYGYKGCPEYNIPPNADLVYEVHLKAFERTKDVWEMNSKEKMDQCDLYKEKGTVYYKKQDYAMAEKSYRNIVDFLENDTCMEGDEETRRRQLLVAGNLNVALVCLKQEKWNEVQERCTCALLIDPNNVKGLYRRGEASYKLKDYTPARADFEKVVELEPDNKAAKKYINRCNDDTKKVSAEEQHMYQKMFAVSSNKTGNENDGNSNSNVFDELGDWNNDMARGMMTLEQECEAFSEILPQKDDNNHGNPHG